VKRLFDVELALHITISTLDALHYAHTLNASDGTPLKIVHRDVTPHNILIDVEGHVKLSDFGIARMDAEAAELKTNRATIKGKYSYLAPELLKRGSPGPASDVYACGVVLRELLTGKNEFRGETIDITVGRVLTHEPTPILEQRKDLPAGLAEIDRRVLAKNPEERYPDAHSYAQALRTIRKISMEEASERLNAAARHDFYDPRIAQLLGTDDLSTLERSWRREYDLGEDAPTQSAPVPLVAAVPLDQIERSIEVVLDDPNLDPTHVDRTSSRPPPPEEKERWGFAAGAAVALVLAAVFAGGFWFARRPAPPPSFVLAEGDVVAVDESGRENVVSQAPVAPPVLDAGIAPPPARKKGNPYSRAVAEKRVRIQKCFTEHAAQADQAIDLRFQIAASGAVEAAEVLPREVEATPLGACLLEVAKTIRFGAQSAPVAVRIPVSVKRKKDDSRNGRE
jgi:serine/threonine-protein kinase